MGLPLAGGGLRQAYELPADRRMRSALQCWRMTWSWDEPFLMGGRELKSFIPLTSTSKRASGGFASYSNRGRSNGRISSPGWRGRLLELSAPPFSVRFSAPTAITGSEAVSEAGNSANQSAYETRIVFQPRWR